MILYRTAYREFLKGIVQFTCLVRENTFVVVHIDGFLNGCLNAKNPVGVILVRGIESVADGVEYPCELLVGDYEYRSAPTRRRLEVVLQYLDGGVEGFRLRLDLLQGCWFDSR